MDRLVRGAVTHFETCLVIGRSPQSGVPGRSRDLSYAIAPANSLY